MICLTEVSSLKMRVEKLENVLIELALHPNRCKYIYVNDLKKALLNKRIVKEKKTIAKLDSALTNKDYTRGLVRNKDWLKRRKVLMQTRGKPAKMDVQAPCHSARFVPCRNRAKPEAEVND